MKTILTISTIACVVSIAFMLVTVFVVPFLDHPFTADQRGLFIKIALAVLCLSLIGMMITSINLGTKEEQPE